MWLLQSMLSSAQFCSIIRIMLEKCAVKNWSGEAGGWWCCTEGGEGGADKQEFGEEA